MAVRVTDYTFCNHELFLLRDRGAHWVRIKTQNWEAITSFYSCPHLAFMCAEELILRRLLRKETTPSTLFQTRKPESGDYVLACNKANKELFGECVGTKVQDFLPPDHFRYYQLLEEAKDNQETWGKMILFDVNGEPLTVEATMTYIKSPTSLHRRVIGKIIDIF